MLIEAKTLCWHGEWADWLKATGIHERAAQRYMLLSKAGFKSDTVSYLGFAAAARYASIGLKLFPSPGHISIGGGRDESGEAFVFWAWRETENLGGYGRIDLNNLETWTTLRRPTYIWSLGATHEMLSTGAQRIDGPQEIAGEDPSIEAVVAKVADLNLWPGPVVG